MLDTQLQHAVLGFFRSHPVFGLRAHQVCIALTGSYALGLGGRGADVDVKVLCRPDQYEAICRELVAAGLIAPGAEPEEEFTDLVGDYGLESVEAVWSRVRTYDDLAQVFVCGNLSFLAGDRELLQPLLEHCRHLPAAVLESAASQERAAFSQALYAFLRSFQNGDPVGRTLARAELLRRAMRLAFLAEGSAPPYDKHLFRLLPRLQQGPRLAELVEQFLGSAATAAHEGPLYAEVAAAADWHAMYAAARGTPAIVFRDAVSHFLQSGRGD